MNHPSLSLVVLRTANLAITKSFYELIGLRFQFEQHGSGPEHYSTMMGNTLLELYPLRQPTNIAEPARLGFAVTSLASILARMETLDIQIVSQPKETEFGTRAVVVDPDGRRVELEEIP